VIEFQKRGLPHTHLLLILDKADAISTPADIDTAISAEIPDPQLYPDLYEIVTTCMIHKCRDPGTPASCYKDGHCSKRFPKPEAAETTLEEDGYPTYRRRNRFPFMHHGITFNDCNVVPYNPFLTAKYAAHINVEHCSSITAPQYLFKYIYKGPDRSAITMIVEEQVGAYDEVQQYLDARYISAPEGTYNARSLPFGGIDYRAE
jgi:hypothetical protein